MNNSAEESQESPAPAPVGRAGNGGKLKVSPEALHTLPADFVKRHRVLPLRVDNGAIHVATAEPGNQTVIDDIRLLSGLEVQEHDTPSAELLEKIAECYQITVEKMIENLNPGPDRRGGGQKPARHRGHGQ